MHCFSIKKLDQKIGGKIGCYFWGAWSLFLDPQIGRKKLEESFWWMELCEIWKTNIGMNFHMDFDFWRDFSGGGNSHSSAQSIQSLPNHG